MTSKEALYLLMTNQKKVRDDFTFINLNTHEKVSIEECYDIVIKDLEILEIIKKWSFIQENYKDGYGTFTQFLCNIHTIGMKKDFNKVKEWLENESILNS